MRPAFPSLFWGREREFEAANILAVHGEKHKSLRAAWQPMFYSGRRALHVFRGGCIRNRQSNITIASHALVSMWTVMRCTRHVTSWHEFL